MFISFVLFLELFNVSLVKRRVKRPNAARHRLKRHTSIAQHALLLILTSWTILTHKKYLTVSGFLTHLKICVLIPRAEGLIATCAHGGRGLQKLTFPGQNANRPLFTLQLTGSQTASLSLSTPPTNATATGINPPLTPVNSQTSTQSPISSVPTASASSNAGPTPTNSASGAGIQNMGWMWVVCLAVGGGGFLNV